MRFKKGLIQIYTGNGKGKTTAAIGLAVRAAGAGLRVYMMQFIKGMRYSEIKALSGLKGIKVEQCGRGCFIKGKPAKKDMLSAEKGLNKLKKVIKSGKFNIVILDEVNVALKLGLISEEDVISLAKEKPASLELVMTGRYCPESIIKIADLVTEMKEKKHPFKKGIRARLGIEF